MRILPILLALGLVVGGSVAPAASAEIDSGDVMIAASPAFSGVLQPNQPLLISGTVTNSSGQAKDAGVASVYLGRTPLITRAALSTWLDSDDSEHESTTTAIATLSVGELAAGQMRSFSITIPASAISLSPGKAGVYPLSVGLSSAEVEIDVARSTVVWASDEVRQNVNLAIVAPLVPPSPSSGLVSSDELEALTAPGGTLDTQLTNARIHSLSLGVDPRIVASIRLLGTSAPPAVTDWLTQLENFAPSTFPLAYADADLVLQRDAGASAPLVPTAFPFDASLFPEEPTETPSPSGSPSPAGIPTEATPDSLTQLSGALDGIAWPSGTNLSDADLDFFGEGGLFRTLAASSSIIRPPGTSPNVTAGEHLLTLSDDTVSALLRKASLATTLAEWSQAMSSLTGALSITATEYPGSTLVATLGRDGSASGESLNKTLTALAAQSWVRPTSLRNALAVPELPATLAEGERETDRAIAVTALFNSEDDTGKFSSVADEPSLVTGPQRLDLLALLSNSWGGKTLEWDAAAEAFLATNIQLRSSVHIPESSQITFPLEKGDLPIAVRNELDVPVTVYVTVRPERAVLDVLNDRVELKIEANSQLKVLIPIQSIANGEVRTKVTLTSATNTPISTPTFVVVNVQAGWETALTVVLAIILVLLFGAGIWRTVLRRRKALARNDPDDETE